MLEAKHLGCKVIKNLSNGTRKKIRCVVLFFHICYDGFKLFLSMTIDGIIPLWTVRENMFESSAGKKSHFNEKLSFLLVAKLLIKFSVCLPLKLQGERGQWQLNWSTTLSYT